MTTKPHGGAREGAGRKPGSTKPDARRLMVNVKLSPEERDFALAIGDGNASEGIRRALSAYPFTPPVAPDNPAGSQ